MCAFGGGGGSPSPAPAPQVIDNTNDNNESAQKAAKDTEKKAALAKGRSSTILSTALGDPNAAPVSRPTLLGGVS